MSDADQADPVNLLRVMTWNIEEGSHDNPAVQNCSIPAIADRIRALSPALVFLNEVVNWAGWPFASGMHQVRELMRLTGYPHAHWWHTAALGLTGHKVVAVLSRFPLGVVAYEPIASGYGYLHTTAVINGSVHRLVSLRLNAYNQDERIQGIRLLAGTIRRSRGESFIVAGDFNCGYTSEPALADYLVGTQRPLRDPFLERPDNDWCGKEERPEPIDKILFRGGWTVTQTLVRCPDPNPSDHPWVVADLARSPTDGLP